MTEANGQKPVSKHTSQRPYGVALPNLREWRLYYTLSQLELAHKAGLTNYTISNIETHGKTAAFSTVHKIADALGITDHQLRYELPPSPQGTNANE